MNPFRWAQQHQIAAAVMTVIGAALGVIVGYHSNAARQPSGFVHIRWWVENHLTGEAGFWALAGGAIGFGLIYVRQLLSN